MQPTVKPMLNPGPSAERTERVSGILFETRQILRWNVDKVLKGLCIMQLDKKSGIDFRVQLKHLLEEIILDRVHKVIHVIDQMIRHLRIW